jgi:Ham1 family
MELLIATHNEAKFNRYRNLLSDIPGLFLQSLKGAGIPQKVDEPHQTSLENAIHKAKEYARLSQKATLAIDESAHTNFLLDDEQPGVFVRRSNQGKELTDQELLDFWREAFKKYPHPDRRFIWEFGIALASPSAQILGSTVVRREDRVANRFSSLAPKGYPMDNFLIPPGLDKPVADCSKQEIMEADKMVFRPFLTTFQGWLRKGGLE